MKTASKVLIIISVCFLSFILFLLFISCIASCSAVYGSVMALAFLLYSLFLSPGIIVGSIALYKLSKAKTKQELTAIAILTLIFCNLISGILMLCMKDEDLNPSLKTKPITPAPVVEPAPSLNNEILKIKQEMNEFGFTSLEEYKEYLALAKENKAVADEKLKKENAEYEEFIKFRDQN